MAEGMKALEFEIVGNTESAVRAISALKSAIEGLKDVKVGKLGLDNAAEEIAKFAEALNKIDVDKLNALQNAATILSSIKETAKGGIGGGLKTFTNNLHALAEEAKNMEGSLDKIDKVGQALQRLSEIGKISISKTVATNIKSIADAVSEISEETLQNLDRLTNYLGRLRGVDLRGFSAASKKASPFAQQPGLVPVQNELATAQNEFAQAQSGLMGSWNTSDAEIAQIFANFKDVADAQNTAGIGAAKFKNALIGVGNALTPVVAKMFELTGMGAASAFQVMLKPFKDSYGNIVKFATGLKGLVRQFARVAMYRMIRTVIKEITQAFKEGTTNLYQWSKAVGGATISGKNFAETMDGLSSSSAYLKNSIGAAVAPFISALAPAIDFAIGKIVALINVINQLLALLGGGMGWNKATYNAKEYGKAAGGAGGAAKEALKYLAPFDELNVLPDDNKGGGGGGASEDYNGMFEYMEEFSEKVANFAQMVKDAWASGDWSDVGTFIGEKINEAIDNIPWPKIGETLGKGINAIIGTEYWTLHTVDFENLGKHISDAFNHMLENINFDIAGRLPVRKLTAIVDTIIGIIKGADWQLVGSSIHDYFVGALREISDWFTEQDFVDLGKAVVSGIADWFRGMEITDISNALYNAMVAAVGAAAGLLAGVFDQLMAEMWGGDTWDFIKVSLGIDTSTWNETIDNWVKNNQIEIPAKGKITGVSKGELRAEQNMVDVTGNVTKVTDGAKDKTLDGVTANITEVNPPKSKKKLDVEGILKIVDMITGSGLIGGGPDISSGYVLLKGLIDTIDQKDIITVDVEGLLNAISPKKGSKYTVDVTGKIESTDKSGLSKKDTTINTTANMNSRNLTELDTSIQTEANFTTRKIGINTSINTVANFFKKVVGFDTTISTVANFVSRIIGFSTTIGLLGKITSVFSESKSPFIVNVIGKIVGTIGSIFAGKGAEGGVYSGGQWRKVQHFASGGLAKGSQLFWAREAGPELVGTLGGHSAVVNNDQIVASVSAGVARAISGISFQMSGMPVMAYNTTDSDENNEDAMYRAFSRALSEADLDHDIILDGYTIYNAMVRRNRLEQSRTGVNPMTA